MAKIELLGLIFNQGFRAVPELFRAVEKTITDYQGKDCLSKEENDRLQKLLDILLKPEIQLHRAVNPGSSASQNENRGSVDAKWSGGSLGALKMRKSKRTRTEKEQIPTCCKVCGRSCHSMRTLLTHLKSHRKDEEHICGVCGKRCPSLESVMDHIQTHMTSHLKPPSECPAGPCCKVCGRPCHSFGALLRHLRRHRKDKEHICGVCGKSCQSLK
ncbi:unnamed protein product, partial [Coregonus sp. 'balchen']